MSRYCDKCGKKMHEGFVIDDGFEYYCSEKCLHKSMTEREYMKLYEDDRAYWTEWEEDDEED